MGSNLSRTKSGDYFWINLTSALSKVVYLFKVVSQFLCHIIAYFFGYVGSSLLCMGFI